MTPTRRPVGDLPDLSLSPKNLKRVAKLEAADRAAWLARGALKFIDAYAEDVGFDAETRAYMGVTIHLVDDGEAATAQAISGDVPSDEVDFLEFWGDVYRAACAAQGLTVTMMTGQQLREAVQTALGERERTRPLRRRPPGRHRGR